MEGKEVAAAVVILIIGHVCWSCAFKNVIATSHV